MCVNREIHVVHIVCVMFVSEGHSSSVFRSCKRLMSWTHGEFTKWTRGHWRQRGGTTPGCYDLDFSCNLPKLTGHQGRVKCDTSATLHIYDYMYIYIYDYVCMYTYTIYTYHFMSTQNYRQAPPRQNACVTAPRNMTLFMILSYALWLSYDTVPW